MKNYAVLGLALLMGTAVHATVVDFEAFNIRNSNGTITAPWDANMSIVENAAEDGFAAVTPMGGQKVGYGTNAFDGCELNDFYTIDWDKVSGKAGVVVYLNFWVTDGNGNYAIISSENDYRGTDFGARQEWKVFEFAGAATDLDCLFDSGAANVSSQYLTRDTGSGASNVTLADFSDDIVLYGGPGVGAAGVGTGAPQGGYGLNLVYGDTQANFVGDYEIENLSVTLNKGSGNEIYTAGAPIPEPATVSLLLMGVGGLVARHRRKRAW